MIFGEKKPASHVFLALLILLLMLVAEKQIWAETGEYTVKAVYLERFTRFIQWPEESAIEDTTRPFVIAVVGQNAYGTTIEEVYKSQKIKNKTVAVEYISSPKDIPSCHLLIVSKMEDEELRGVLALTESQPILTVSDTPGYAEKGLLINFVVREDKVQFEINEKAVRAADLSISHHLLRVARIVESDGDDQ